MRHSFLTLVLAVTGLAACQPPPTAPDVDAFVPMDRAEWDRALANADSIIAIGEPVVTTKILGDTSSPLRYQVTTTRQRFQVIYPMDDKGQVIEKTSSPSAGKQGAKGCAIGSASCSLYCTIGSNSGCSYSGCTFDRAAGHCTPGDCGGCQLDRCDEDVDCVKKDKKGRPV